MGTIVECKNIIKQFRQGETTVDALRGISATFEEGDFVSISGPSGSGKSTLLHIIGSLERPSEGEVLIDGVSLSGMSKRELADLRLNRIGFIFQAYNLLPVLSVIENVTFIPQLQGVDAATRNQRGMALLREVGLENLENRRPAQISGGQQQRVAVARALAGNPAIVLADEPTANLDSKNSDELLALMSRLNVESGVTFIVATHDPRVIAHTRRHMVLTDGRIDTDERKAA